MKIHTVGDGFFHADGKRGRRMDRRTETNRQIRPV